MTHPHNLEFAGDPSDYDGVKIRFEIVRENSPIIGEGILKVDRGAVSGKIRSYIDCKIFDGPHAIGRYFSLSQDEFDRVYVEDHPDLTLILINKLPQSENWDEWTIKKLQN